MLSEQSKKEIADHLARYPLKQSALIPALHIAQRQFGYLSDEVMLAIAAELGLPPSEVRAVATFYTMFNKKKVGKYHIQVCQNLTCSMLGAEPIVAFLERKLGIKTGQTTADERFTLSRVECLGACGTAPVIQINDDYHENMTAGRLEALLESLK
jgi:NADH-quinone oxidoreductase E subunit